MMIARRHVFFTLAVALGGYDIAEAQTDAHESPLLEIRLAATDPVPDFTPVTVEGESFYVAPEPVVSDGDFLSVEPIYRDGQMVLNMHCAPEAADRLRTVTEQHIGQPAAILWKSEVRTAPLVRSPVSCDRAQIAWPAEEDEARGIAATVRKRWPSDGMVW